MICIQHQVLVVRDSFTTEAAAAATTTVMIPPTPPRVPRATHRDDQYHHRHHRGTLWPVASMPPPRLRRRNLTSTVTPPRPPPAPRARSTCTPRVVVNLCRRRRLRARHIPCGSYHAHRRVYRPIRFVIPKIAIKYNYLSRWKQYFYFFMIAIFNFSSRNTIFFRVFRSFII